MAACDSSLALLVDAVRGPALLLPALDQQGGDGVDGHLGSGLDGGKVPPQGALPL